MHILIVGSKYKTINIILYQKIISLIGYYDSFFFNISKISNAYELGHKI